MSLGMRALRQHGSVRGPSKMDLLEAFFFNRGKILKFVQPFLNNTTNYPQVEGQLRGLISMRNPNHFIVILHSPSDVPGFGDYDCVLAYDTVKRQGSACLDVGKTLPLAEMINRDSCDFE